MPRIPQYADVYAKEDFLKEVRRQQGEYGLMTQRALSLESDIGTCRLCTLLKDPKRFTLEEIGKLNGAIQIDPLVVLKLAGFSDKQIKRMKGENKYVRNDE